MSNESDKKGVLQKVLDWGPFLRWRMHRRNHRDGLKVFQEGDSEKSEASKLPDDETISLPGIWVTEIFTPSTVSQLLEGIRRLGWEEGRASGKDLTTWMDNVREGRSAGWISLGLVGSERDSHRFFPDRVGPLPKGVIAIHPTLISITPGITALVVGFEFDKDNAESLNEPLRRDFKTIVRPHKKYRLRHLLRYLAFGERRYMTRSIVSPQFRRRDEFKNCHNSKLSSCVNWIERWFPGSLANMGLLDKCAATLLLTDTTPPFSDQSADIEVFRWIGLSQNYDIWSSKDWPSARVQLPRGTAYELDGMIFAVRRDDAIDEGLHYAEPKSNSSIFVFANDGVRGFLSRWAIKVLLDGYHQSISRWRDQIATVENTGVLSDLKEFRELSKRLFYDIDVCTQEIADFVDKHALFRHDVIELESVDGSGNRTHHLIEIMRDNQRARSDQVGRDAGSLRNVLFTSNQLSQTISTVKVQRVLVYLSIISTVVALFTSGVIDWLRGYLVN